MSSSRIRFAQRAAVVILAAVGAALPQIVTAQGEALVGKWILVPERSKATPGPARYKEMTITFSAAGKGFSKTIEGVDASGKAVKGTAEVVADGKAHPVTGIGLRFGVVEQRERQPRPSIPSTDAGRPSSSAPAHWARTARRLRTASALSMPKESS